MKPSMLHFNKHIRKGSLFLKIIGLQLRNYLMDNKRQTNNLTGLVD